MKQTTIALLAGLALTFTSCKKDTDSTSPSGAREREVEYRVSSPTSGLTADVIYGNETGGNTTENNVSLPKSYKFKRTLKPGDNVVILAQLKGATASSEITGTILLDGKQVASETGRGSSAQAVPVYVVQ